MCVQSIPASTHMHVREHTLHSLSSSFVFFSPSSSPPSILSKYKNVCCRVLYFKCYLHPRTCCCRLVPCHIPRLHMPVVYSPIRGNCRLPHQRFTLKSPDRWSVGRREKFLRSHPTQNVALTIQALLLVLFRDARCRGNRLNGGAVRR